eukprot:3210928-Amphidinium_carterae.2
MSTSCSGHLLVGAESRMGRYQEQDVARIMGFTPPPLSAQWLSDSEDGVHHPGQDCRTGVTTGLRLIG